MTFKITLFLHSGGCIAGGCQFLALSTCFNAEKYNKKHNNDDNNAPLRIQNIEMFSDYLDGLCHYTRLTKQSTSL